MSTYFTNSLIFDHLRRFSYKERGRFLVFDDFLKVIQREAEKHASLPGYPVAGEDEVTEEELRDLAHKVAKWTFENLGPHALAFKCDMCGAEPGDRCVTVNGTERDVRGSHAIRHQRLARWQIEGHPQIAT